MSKNAPKRVFVAMPFNPDFFPIYEVIKEASVDVATRTGCMIKLVRADEMRPGMTLMEHIYDAIRDTDLLIADVSQHRPNVMFELGYAHALNKPVILIGSELSERQPFDIADNYVLLYGPRKREKALLHTLVERISEALLNPDRFVFPSSPSRSSSQNNKPSVFISYSHVDREFLTRLQIHLRPLVKDKRIDLWDDTRIQAGEKWKEQITGALERAAIAILMISADFLASDFIVDNELPPLLRAAEEKGTTILPVILKPCRFLRDKHLAVFQAINDPREPLIKLAEAEQEELYARISERVENEIGSR